MKFGEKLRKFRLEKGMDQTELAKAAGIHVNTVSNYESGKTYPKKREVYITLANILGVEPNSLHNEEDDFISDASAKYGSRGANQAKALTDEVTGLFAGGNLSEEDMDVMMKAISDAYWIAKEKNKKYTRKDYRKE